MRIKLFCIKVNKSTKLDDDPIFSIRGPQVPYVPLWGLANTIVAYN